MLKSKKQLQSTCSSSSFGHLTDLPKSEASSFSAPSAAFWVGVMLQIAFQILPGTITLCSCLLPTHSLRWALQVLQLQTTVKKTFLRKNSGDRSKNYGKYPNVIGNHPTFNFQNSGFIFNITNVSSCTNSVVPAPPDLCVTLHALKTPV